MVPYMTTLSGRPVCEWTDRWNPFNSTKLLAHVPRWAKIAEGEIPPPALLQVDLAAQCNLGCVWCNARYALSGHRMTPGAIGNIIALCRERKITAICLGGGGESTINSNCSNFILWAADAGIRVGLVTNGVLPLSPEAHAAAAWVAVSVDAATPETFRRLKGVDAFDLVLSHIRTGDTYDFLVHPDNVGELAAAARLAREKGCRFFHARPVSAPWFSDAEYIIEGLADQVDRAREYETDDFRVICATHKQRPTRPPFSRCHAIYMTCVLTPAATGFNIELCCDRRGDSRLMLATDTDNFDLWGSEKHRNMVPVLSDCPRCTCQPHNVIYEQVIERDAMTWEFC